MLLRDISWCCRCHQKRCGGMGCAVVQQACSEVCTVCIKVTCSSVWLCCISSLLPESCSYNRPNLLTGWTYLSYYTRLQSCKSG